MCFFQAQYLASKVQKDECMSKCVDTMIRIHHLERKKAEIQRALDNMSMLKANPSLKLADLPSAPVHPKLGDFVVDDLNVNTGEGDPLDNLDINDVGF